MADDKVTISLNAAKVIADKLQWASVMDINQRVEKVVTDVSDQVKVMEELYKFIRKNS